MINSQRRISLVLAWFLNRGPMDDLRKPAFLQGTARIDTTEPGGYRGVEFSCNYLVYESGVLTEISFSPLSIWPSRALRQSGHFAGSSGSMPVSQTLM